MAKSGSAKNLANQTHQRYPTVSISNVEANRAFAIDAARMLSDDKCEDIVLLDVTGISQVADFVIIATGTSDRQMRSSGDDVAKLGETKHESTLFRRDIDERATWILLDFVDVVVHVFEPNTRAHYDIEMLWADAPRLEWERDDQRKRDRAGIA
jgi:ribosome-associated protein